VQRNRHHVLAVVKRRLHAVVVMRVHIEIENPFAGVRQFQARKRHVVEITKTGGAFRKA